MIQIPYEFDTATVNLIIRGLGMLPHDEVANTIAQIRHHAQAEIARAQAQAEADATALAAARTVSQEPPAPPSPAKRTRKKA